MAHHTGTGLGGGSRFGSNQFGDTTLTKVFVGGLAWETHRETMRRHFEHFGEILEAVVITDKNTGRSKGYGFVTFRDPEAARRACEDPTPVIDGRRANCNLASLGSRPRPSAPPYGVRFRPMHSPSPSSPTGAHGYAAGPAPAFSHVVPFPYQQGFAYPSYGYPQYSPDYAYQQVSKQIDLKLDVFDVRIVESIVSSINYQDLILNSI
ncbi:hypothetical protein O6H91_Y260900 [Diphasiastrum complanatum]|nr:hypothetical protein O6H91_Y260900 [Diphasiastrum complanatum]KAJ7294381.1 hypothetical protein O6H91_Y260900 [Diphasiastrum complanatum]KAJ7294382.1 hypothetical protein O6H91_Y260900 [Diphasiastrum complanatum]KAJ7294383.1 hypothetical protein O6H91_Y260900 [Diphasiastrum complanatum]